MKGAGCCCPALSSMRAAVPACRAEKSFTHRHLCEFTGLDMEMAIDRHYAEAMDVIDRLFVYMFSGLNGRCSAPHPLAAPLADHALVSHAELPQSDAAGRPACAESLEEAGTWEGKAR